VVTAIPEQNVQTAQIDLTPIITENRGLHVSASPNCDYVVPYAKKDSAGVIEIVDFASFEATQNHNLFADNVQTTVATMGDKFRLDDTRALTARSAQEWFENNFWIQANFTATVPSARFPTIQSIADYLRDYRIKPDVFVTVNLLAGLHSPVGSVDISHPDGLRITYRGAALASALPDPDTLPVMTGFNSAADKAALDAILPPIWTTQVVFTGSNGFTSTSGNDMPTIDRLDLSAGNNGTLYQCNRGARGNVTQCLFRKCARGVQAALVGGQVNVSNSYFYDCAITCLQPISGGNILTLGFIALLASNSAFNALRMSSIDLQGTNTLISGHISNGCSVTELSQCNMYGTKITITRNNVNGVTVDDGSNLNFNNVGNLVSVRDNTGNGIVLRNNSTLGTLNGNAIGLSVTNNSANGVVLLEGSTAKLAQTTITGNISNGISANNGSTTLLDNATITGNGTDILASHMSLNRLNALTVFGTASPLLGVVGNVNSVNAI
jgi:hypothetical protein